MRFANETRWQAFKRGWIPKTSGEWWIAIVFTTVVAFLGSLIAGGLFLFVCLCKIAYNFAFGG